MQAVGHRRQPDVARRPGHLHRHDHRRHHHPGGERPAAPDAQARRPTGRLAAVLRPRSGGAQAQHLRRADHRPDLRARSSRCRGMEGKMFSPLAFTVALALLSSLLLSIFVIPVVCLAGRSRPVHTDEPGVRDEPAARLPAGAPVGAGAPRPSMLVVAARAADRPRSSLLPRLGTEFMPVMDEGAFDMDVQLLPSVSLDKAHRDRRARSSGA
ncbi:MAG: hypothetical protein MZV63_23940 [Marinilabiliales bacterium]|nr:hypothetical protein [Marinilabiliales bacterium]